MFKAVKISSSASCSATSGKLKSPLFDFFASSEVLDSPEEERSLLFFSRILFNKVSINDPRKNREYGGRLKDTF